MMYWDSKASDQLMSNPYARLSINAWGTLKRNKYVVINKKTSEKLSTGIHIVTYIVCLLQEKIVIQSSQTNTTTNIHIYIPTLPIQKKYDPQRAMNALRSYIGDNTDKPS